MNNQQEKHIILLHGLHMRGFYLTKMRKFFENKNFKVHYFNYFSTFYSEKTIQKLKIFLDQFKNKEVYFIGHSMGGLLIRKTFQDFSNDFQFKDTAIITIGTPHYTSHTGKYISQSIFKPLLGKAGDSGIIKELSPWNLNTPIGCIAGVSNYGFNSILQPFHQKYGDNDGTVFLEEAILTNCTDSIIVKQQHTQMIYSQEVMNLCEHFIQFKNFKSSNKMSN